MPNAVKVLSARYPEDVRAYEKDIQDELYYHGFMVRTEAEQYLEQQGQFLVRRVQEADQFLFIVSVQWEGVKLHYKIHQTEHGNWYYLNKNQEPKRTVPSLIRFHFMRRVPINQTSKACLKRPVERNDYAVYRDQVELGEVLGEGEFGTVYSGILRLGLFSRVSVAVKTMKDEDGSKLSMDEKIKFMREANLMMVLKHKNVIRLYGVCVYDEPIWIVLECAKGGSLLGRLRNANPPSEVLKLKFSKELCEGMVYLADVPIMHRDLAARNILLGKNDTVKIADFGLSLKGKSVKITSGKMPIRWLPPETLLHNTYTLKSDVWSYGCVLYEIWSNGLSPYHEVLSNKVVSKGIRTGELKLLMPQGMPELMSHLMKAALTFDESERPDFKQLQQSLSKKAMKKAASTAKAKI